MKRFYKIVDGYPQRGSGTVVPEGFIEYIDGKEPQELLDALVKLEVQQVAQKINNAIQNLLDTTAQSLRYDNMMSARSYAGYVNPFQEEAQALAVWASECWVVAGQIEADVIAGTRPMPTVDEVLAELPTYGV